MNLNIYSFGISALLFITGCNKIVDIKPDNELDIAKIYGNDNLATSAVIGIYKSFTVDISPMNGLNSRIFPLAAGDLIKLSATSDDTKFLTLSWKADDIIISNIWNKCYNYIYHCNSVLVNLSGSKSISTQLKYQLEGEAKFLRALVYFYLVNCFDSIPLVLEIDPKVTAGLHRARTPDVYRQITSDLIDAQKLLPDEYPQNSEARSPRIRANRSVADALLARVSLYVGHYENANLLSTKVINSGQYILENLDNVFVAQSPETIFALYPTMEEYNTVEGRIFGINPNTEKAAFAISPALLDSFDSNDLRVSKWMQSYTSGGATYKLPFKYKIYASSEDKIAEYNIVLRLAEMYLIRAEANLKLGNLKQAISDINLIRKRANAVPLSLDSERHKIRQAIELENQREFFAEFGHRWFDLRRWEGISDPTRPRINEVLGQSKKEYWAPHKINLPIPADELNKSKLNQNIGY